MFARCKFCNITLVEINSLNISTRIVYYNIQMIYLPFTQRSRNHLVQLIQFNTLLNTKKRVKAQRVARLAQCKRDCAFLYRQALLLTSSE